MGPGVRGQGDFLPALPSKAAEPAFSCDLTCECFALPRRCPSPVYDENLRVSYSKTRLSLLLLHFLGTLLFGLFLLFQIISSGLR